MHFRSSTNRDPQRDRVRRATRSPRLRGLSVALLAGLFAFPAVAQGIAADLLDRKCANGTYTVISGDTCPKIYSKLYCGKSTLFQKYNGVAYVDSLLYTGRILCKPTKSCT